MSLEISVAFNSDWHIGVGAGGAEGADRAVVRDHHDFPFVPAKSLTGILRDATETITEALGSDWSDWVPVLFGSQPASSKGSASTPPQPAAVSLRPLHLSDALKATLGRPEQLRRLTHIKAGVSIDADTGTAINGRLSFVEMNRPVSLSGRVDIDLVGTDRETAIVLLSAACAFVESIGGKRRKGAGRCKVTLLENGQVIQPDYATALPTRSPMPPTFARATTPQATWTDDGSELVGVDVVLTTRTPLLAATRSIGNIVESLDHVPGGVLVPHLHGWLESAGADAKVLIATNRARISRAVPTIDGQRAKPVPFALQRPKDATSRAWRDATQNQPDDGVITKQVRSGWIGGAESLFNFAATVPQTSATHNIIDDQLQTPTADTGGLFTYVAISAGVRLHVRLMIPSGLRESFVAAMTATRFLRVGRSKKDDYGSVIIDLAEAAVPDTQVAQNGEQVRIWATSDIIPSHATSAAGWLLDLCEAAGIDGALVSCDQERSRVRFARIDSWQATWGFPRPTLEAISAGSVLVVQSADRSALEAIRSLTGKSFGKRLVEGFGEIVVDHPLLSGSTIDPRPREVDVENAPSVLAELTDSEQIFAQSVSRAVMQQRIRTAAITHRSKGGSWLLKDDLSASQLGRLRGWVQNLQGPLVGDQVKQLDHDVEKWKPTPKSKVKDLLTKATEIWKTLEVSESDRLDHLGRDMSEDMWGEAVRAFVESSHREKSRGTN